ncbi:YitT family protein [Ammoniphilus resinae]|uniref:Uncharacterized membrane-anchored protein YitT (DUF2179 family) n=1 Tax=Ammoniphilus resinae TaxID=861532 RepID=A0ABS4GM79_9BACL|nr:YitT family protein [Ammoniphilus resinae]MBP1931382.1 uncharacterized membrane-anchored protein YitT (DUF2179 family) [Ammoniphilus resinae]
MRMLLLFFGIVFFAVGNLLFAVPNHIMNGGMTGLSLMTYYIFHTNIGLNLFLFNLPLFLIAFFYFRELFYKSIVSMIILSLVVGILQDYLIPYGIHNMWIGSIVGGFWMGIALGILAKLNASLGGGSLAGKMLHQRYGFSLSASIFIVDSSVFPLSVFVIGARETMFSIILTATSAIGVYLVGKISEWIHVKEESAPTLVAK